MNWRTTWMLVALAGVLFAFIWLVERHAKPTFEPGGPTPRLLSIRADEVTSLQLRRTNQFVLRVDRTNQSWNLTAPITYPAQNFAIQSLLQALEELPTQTCIPPSELAANRRNAADYGLEVPHASLTLQQSGQRIELLFGSKTSVGDQVFVQLLTAPDIYLVPADVFDRLPHGVDDWRDPALVILGNLVLDRFEVRSTSRGFAVHVDTTNNLFRLSKPTPARADRAKVEALLRKIETARITNFVTDSLTADLEPFGLQPPEVELVFGQGTNDVIVIQFGRSPTNNPALVYARCLAHTNVVLVSKAVLEAVQTPFNELRDRRLMAFAPGSVDRIEIVADEKFVVARQTNNTWMIEPPLSQIADPDSVGECFETLVRLEGNVEKDVVTDFSPYGLAPPTKTYSLYSVLTNASGGTSNRLLGQLGVGLLREDRRFVRGTDPNTVYWVTRGDYEQLPSAAWQLRDRRVWRFTTNQVTRIALRHNGYTREMVRQAGAWKLAPGSQGVINPFAIEEMMFQLGELRAQFWVDRGERNRGRYGFREDGSRLAIELKGGDKAQTLVLELAVRAETGLPLALATVDDQTWIFKMVPKAFFDLIKMIEMCNPPKN